MSRALLLSAFIGLTPLTPAVAADISYTLSVTDPGGAGQLLLAWATLPDFVAADTLVWAPQLQYCSSVYLRCDSLQFIIDSHAAGISGSPYAALGLVEHYPEGGGGSTWFYFPQGVFSTPGRHHALFSNSWLAVSQVPEPATASLMGLGVGAVLLMRRRLGKPS